MADQAWLPDGLRVYAIGDVHGRLDCLHALEALIRADLARAPAAQVLVVQLGDLVDRGPDSRGVLEHLATTRDGLDRRLLRGNHEAMLLDALEDADALRHWCDVGGADTLISYGVDPHLLRRDGPAAVQAALHAALPARHLALLRGQEAMLEIGGYCFVHAGLRPGIAPDRQDLTDLLWIREEFLQFPGGFGTVVVHGHTPVAEPDRRPNRINVDTGAFLTGRLTAAVLEGTGVRFLVAIPAPPARARPSASRRKD